MERLLNRSQQGDLGEASAIEWLTSKGAAVLIPFGHSPHFDLVAEIDRQLVRIQVKSSTQETQTPEGHPRLTVAVRTCGGNQSWNRVAKVLDPSKFDYLFVLTGQGRRWLIPAGALDGRSAITLGGPKYAECEIEPGRPIVGMVYGDETHLESVHGPGEYPRGQRMAAVNRPAQSFAGSTPASPISTVAPTPTRYERKLGQSGQAVINQKRRITIPQRAFFEAGLANGGKVRVRSDGPGRLVIEQIELPPWARSDESEDADGTTSG